MPYQLDHRSQGASAHASVTTWQGAASTVWSIEFEIEIFSLSNTIPLGGATYAARIAQITTNGTVSCQNSSGGTVLTSAVGAAVIGVNTIRVERTSGGLWQLTVNGVSVSTTSSVASAPMTYLATRVQSTYFSTNLAIRRVTTSGGTYSTSWNGTNAPSTGTTWTSSGGQVATLNSFTGAANSWWVFYSSGATYQLTAQGGTFSYSGGQANLLRNFKLTTLGAAYAYSGASANLTYVPVGTVYTLTAQGGSFAYSGANADVRINRKLVAQGGSYSYSGGSTSLLRGFKLSANGGAYSYAGASADLTYTQINYYRLTALGATYAYAGGAAQLTAIGVTPLANPSAYVVRAYVGGAETVRATVGGLASISAKIGGRQTINAMVAQ